MHQQAKAAALTSDRPFSNHDFSYNADLSFNVGGAPSTSRSFPLSSNLTNGFRASDSSHHIGDNVDGLGGNVNSKVARPDSPPPITLARPFRSRKNRPCDGCRRAKTRCAIVEIGTPCVECQHTRKKCTFDEKPRERKKPAKKLDDCISAQVSSAAASSSSTTISPSQTPAVERTSEEITIDYNPAPLKRQRTGKEDFNGVSLEETLGYHMITSVLTDDLLPVGARRAGSQGDEHIRQISAVNGGKPQYVIFSKKVETPHPRPPASVFLSPVYTALSLLQPPPPAVSVLLEVYLEKSNRAFPILPPALNGYPAPILAKIYVSALNHLPRGQYRPFVRGVRELLSKSNPGMHRSSLVAIADALLDVSARPSGNAEEHYLVLAKAIAQAQLIGLHLDPSDWGIPEWEKDYRRVLWWALRVHDGWSSFLNSRPSHIQANNHDVGVPDLESIRTTTADDDGLAFHLLCRLAVLVSRLQREICTVMARREDKEERVGRVVEIEDDLEYLLVEVKDGFKPGNGREPAKVTGFYSFMTALLGFRCMIRRIAIELSIGLGAPFTPDPDTLSRYAQAVDYIASLPAEAFDAWWLVHIGHILSSVMSSLIRLSLATTSSTPDSPAISPSFSPKSAKSSRPPTILPVQPSLNPIFLLARLRHALQHAQAMYKWDMADAAVARADNVARVLGNLIEGEDESTVGDYGYVVKALKGQPVVSHSSANLATMHASPCTTLGGQWNIDLSLLGTQMDWTGFEGFDGMQPVGDGQGWSPDYGFTSN